jgi:tripartite-type tricarboxylate transporter receptor subunit TctC
LPRALINRILEDLTRVLAARDIRDKLDAQRFTPFVSTPDQMASLLKAESSRYAVVIHAANIKLSPPERAPCPQDSRCASSRPERL